MSAGMVVCSECAREIHQDGPFEQLTAPNGSKYSRRQWQHCDDKTSLCDDARVRWPLKGEPLGEWCGRDGQPPQSDDL